MCAICSPIPGEGEAGSSQSRAYLKKTRHYVLEPHSIKKKMNQVTNNFAKGKFFIAVAITDSFYMIQLRAGESNSVVECLPSKH